MAKPKLPRSFFWGAGTSAHQVEGGNHNDWSVWEQANAERLAQLGVAEYTERSPIWPEVSRQVADPANYISGRAVEHYERYEADFDLARELGHNAHRLSLEWSRIEPEPGVFDEAALEHYRSVIQALRQRGMEPFVTLWHFTLPTWLAEQGGWTAAGTPARFAAYTQRVVAALGGDISYWMTLNEPVEYAQASFLNGHWPPEQRSRWQYWRAKRHLRQAHVLAARIIHAAYPTAHVGLAHSAIYMDARGKGPWQHLLKRAADWDRNDSFLKPILGDLDYIGVNFYFRFQLGWWYGVAQAGPRSDMGWELCPEGLEWVLDELAQYGKPLMVTENGLADNHDSQREHYTTAALDAVSRSLAHGTVVLGYLHWSLLDNFELNRGFWPRFGLVQVDHATLERSIRPSAKAVSKYYRSLL